MSKTDGYLSEIFIGSLQARGNKAVTDTSAAIRGISKQIRCGKLKAQNSDICCEDA